MKAPVSAPPRGGTFRPPTARDDRAFVFSGKARELGPALADLNAMVEDIRRHGLLAVLAVVLTAILAWGSTVLVRAIFDTATYTASVHLSVLGCIFVVVAYIWNKAISKARSVNPSAESNSGCLVVFIFLGIWVLFPVLASFEAWWPLVVTLKERVFFGADPQRTLIAIGISILWVATLCGVLYLRRLRKTAPQGYEMYLYRQILGNLIRDLPPTARCDVELNPFPAFWSEWDGKAKSGKTAYFDLLLKASIRIGGRRLSLRIVHRRTRKGRGNKHKGYKQKVKVSVRITDPRLVGVPAKVRDSLIEQALLAEPEPGQVRIQEPFPYKERLEGALRDTTAPGAIGWIETYLNLSSFGSALAAKDTPSPREILRRIRRAFLEIDGLPRNA